MQIIKKKLISSAHGTHKYYVEWLGEWTEKELVDAVDGSTGNYGGCVHVTYRKFNYYKGFVEVYYE